MKVLCGYNANIDAVYPISGAEVEILLASADTKLVEEKIQNPPGVIHELEDLLAGLIFYMKSGHGGEWFVHSPEVLNLLRERFLPDSHIRMGGNMAIMSNVFAALGVDHIVPNIVILPESQKNLFAKHSILFPENGDYQSNPENEPIHFVFDFKKGDSFSFNGKRIEVPRENRFIATFDDVNAELEISPFFHEYSDEHIMEMNGAIVSGFHMLQPFYEDGTSFSDKLKPALLQITGWKEKNSSMPIHAELGHFASVDIEVEVFTHLARIVDSIGMNEDELADLVATIDSPVPGVREMNMKALLEAACRCMDVSEKLPTLIIHTRDLVFSVSRDEKQVFSCIESLDFGIKTAAAFASSGKLESREFVEKASASLERSEYGVKEIREITTLIGGVKESAGIRGTYDAYEVCAIPTLIAEKPVVTVGLGDTFSAASFLRFLELNN
ncbi:ADP-dependent phosphofructokinase/glucokinase [Methanohalophilus levihalophilus]|uniref:ADP-dependent glucokinase/phosphofructokinase n=1 Tax=Methanohalophilus levihalophilus TaxID=1431282 RepID=UPI001AE87415|nr:ADP-dependent glucokinase/phosphofructokinase [Methanohalophilus levihalophilus]MBP2030927.1 ADP-dependent phosphofructokinase/glucokinase [Methanohalophilus levihalophilus]